ncbi:GNAT family N-acetyltransferase [Botrimarina mediterranea]|nr:GNAT family N-acetyltransferase [Botrimarina mediterranea]
MPPLDESIAAAHHVRLVGFDLINESFVFQNTWGPGWGNAGFGTMPFEYFDRYLIDAWITQPLRPEERYQISEPSLLRWNEADILASPRADFHKVFCMEHFDPQANESLGWAFLTVRGTYLDVEELFVKPTFRRQGLATAMVADILGIAAYQKRRVRMWVSFSDWLENESSVRAIACKLHLALKASNKRWAAVVGLPGQGF